MSSPYDHPLFVLPAMVLAVILVIMLIHGAGLIEDALRALLGEVVAQSVFGIVYVAIPLWVGYKAIKLWRSC